MWDSHARLAQVVGAGANESYLYDETGQRIRKTNNLTGVSTFYPVGGFEQTSGGAVTKHYSFGGRFVAVRGPSGALSFLFEDQHLFPSRRRCNKFTRFPVSCYKEQTI